jgi:hypothetical protein
MASKVRPSRKWRRSTSGLHVNALGNPTSGDYTIYDAGAPYNRVHMTILKAFGLTDAEIELNGQPGFGEYGTVTTSSNDHRFNGIGYSNAKRKTFTNEDKRATFPILAS